MRIAANELIGIDPIVKRKRKQRLTTIENVEMTVPFGNRVASLTGKCGDIRAGGNARAATIGVILPVVIRALDLFAHHSTAA
jgi:hypothetical protein